jgi:putative cell wall-binding protein
MSSGKHAGRQGRWPDTSPAWVRAFGGLVAFLVTIAALVAAPAQSASAVTPPDPPTNVQATAGSNEATVTWTPPLNDGGSPITKYKITAQPGSASANANAGDTSAVVTGLWGGQTYSFVVRAVNIAGASAPSASSNAVTVTGTAASVPDAPTGVTATPGDGSATVTWTPPASDGGTAITSYRINVQPGTLFANAGPSDTSVSFTGLTNGVAVSFTVKAYNDIGPSAASLPSNEVTPAGSGGTVTVPSEPTTVTATAGDSSATITWSPPASDGGSPITSYRITGRNTTAEKVVGGSVTSVLFDGLTNGTPYKFKVYASNSVGEGLPSVLSNEVVPAPAPATVPGAPTGVSAVAGNAQATVSWTAPASDGGSAITQYVITSTNTTAQKVVGASVRSVVFDGLTNGTAYKFKVAARNAVGLGPASALSPALTPQAPPLPGTVERWAGPDRYASSAAFSAKSFAAGVNVAYIASGVNFPDALSGAPVAGMTRGPVLLTQPLSLPSSIATELKRLQPKRIVVLGGTGAVSTGVQNALDAYTTGAVERWAGRDRFASSAVFSAKSFPVGVNVAYVASGMNFPDALSGAPIAGKTAGPILLTGTTSLPGSITTELRRLKPKKIVVLGGTGAVGSGVQSALDAYTAGAVERWAGSDRYASSAAFSAKSFQTGVAVAFVASGLNFPDALSGAPIAGKTPGPVLLTGTTSLPTSVANELNRLRPKKIVVLGGTGVVSPSVATQLKRYLG